MEIRRPGRGTDNSQLSSTEVKNVWSFSSVPTYALMAHFVRERRREGNATKTRKEVGEKNDR
jgi:hypothetical protein